MSTTSERRVDAPATSIVDDSVDHAVAVLSALSGLLRTSRAAGRRLHEGLGASGTPLAVLKTLAQRDGHDRPGDLAAATGVAPSVVSRVIARLEEEGLVNRRPDESDARACRIGLTADGYAHLRRVQRQTAALFAPTLAELEPADVERLPRLLTQLEQALGRASEQAATTRHAHLHHSTATESD